MTLLLDHLYFVRARVLDAARAAPEALAAPDAPSIRGLHATLVHLFSHATQQFADAARC